MFKSRDDEGWHIESRSMNGRFEDKGVDLTSMIKVMDGKHRHR